MKLIWRASLLTLIGLFISITAFSQGSQEKHHSLKVGSGGQFLGTGDHIGFVFHAEYTLHLTDRLGFSLAHLNGSAESFVSGGNFYSAKIWTIDVLANYVPFQQQADWFSISLGPSLRLLKSLEGAGYQTVDDELNPQNHGSSIGYPVYRDEVSVGLTTMVNVRLLQKGQFFITTNPFLQGLYSTGDVAWGTMICVGFKL
ncbi:hypothetical protein [Marinoscillum furvescens]|uniref:Uncharacterized protein n=1 Tax=Marinoscillum furvescens DSM 4134 TaxID=1122208 RepID=A0A3D9LIV5_MARFU|nr:hypothetical protein [Marinoscillum furvescens]REE05959.1 hypothetical protein C7460_101478 [Marinoscillum furvescens DSM 4134]